MKRFLMLAMLACVAMGSATQTEAKAEAVSAPDDSWVRMGVIVASQNGLGEDRPLRFAYRDGEKLERMLATVGQIAPADLFMFKREDRKGLLASLADAGARMAEIKASGRKVFLQFYYTGHGEAHYFHFRDGRVSFDEVKEALGAARADARVYVLDVCYGASFFNSKGFSVAPPLQLRMDVERAARGEVTISSSAVDEQAYEVRTLGGSIFTSHWIMALRGAGDRNRDGQVTLFEAYNYAYDRTSGYSAETLARPQHPSFQMDLTGARDMMLARHMESSTGLLFQACPAGNYSLLDMQRGIQIGELRMPQGEEFSLALEPGRYRVQYLPPRGEAVAADVELKDGGMTRLPFAAFSARAAAPGVAKGSETTAEEVEGPARGFEGAPETSAGREGIPAPSRPSSSGSGGGLGWAAWTGFGVYGDSKLRSALDARPGVDEHFGMQGGFGPIGPRPIFGFDLGAYALGSWYLGGRLGFSSAAYTMHATGKEDLASVPDSNQGRYPVNLSWRLDFNDMTMGAYLGRAFRLGHRQVLGLEAFGGWDTRTAKGERTLERPLYASTVRESQNDSKTGPRFELALVYGMYFALPGMRRNLGVSLRAAPYVQGVKGLQVAGGDAGEMDSDERGATLSLMVSFLPPAFARREAP